MFIVEAGFLSKDFLSNGMAIHFRRLLGNLERTWLMHSPFWLYIWSIVDYAHSQGGDNIDTLAILAFGSLLLIVCLYICLHICLYGCVLICLLCILYH